MREGILFCGAIGNARKPARGGYESGNRRLVRLLSLMGHRVTELPYPQPASSTFQKLVAYGVGFCRLGMTVAVTGRRHRTLYFVPLTQVFLPVEFLLCVAGCAAGMRIILHLRAGRQIYDYRSRTFMYRVLFRTMIELADVVACQATVYQDFVHGLSPAKPCYFLPNFVFSEEISDCKRTNGTAGPHMVYVGLVSEEKGCAHAISVLHRVRRVEPGATLTLVGKVSDEFAGMVRQIDMTHVQMTGPLTQTELERVLDQGHYFVFLSHWIGEGHSNALTEAMGRGCVPIATRHGFNETVVGDAGLIVDDRSDAGGVATQILEHWGRGAWRQDSQCAVRRVEECFSEVVIRRALDEICGPVSASVKDSAGQLSEATK